MNNQRSVRDDPALPALAELFRHEGAPPFVADAVGDLTGETLAPEAFNVSYVRYRPGKSCVVGWSWENAEGVRLLASGRIFYNERADKLLARPANRRVIDAAAALIDIGVAPYRYFSQQHLLLQLFPLDLRLPDLVLAADPVWLAENLLMNGRKRQSRSITATVISYKPWRRCVYRYDIDEGERQASFYAKVFRDHRGAAQLEWNRAIRTALIEPSVPWTIPTAVGYMPEARMLLFHTIRGATKVRSMLRPAMKHDEIKRVLLRHISAAGAGLAAFQRTSVDGLPSQTPQDLLATLRDDCRSARSVAPDFAERAASALDQLEASARALPAEPLVPTHGAFRHDQLLHVGEHLIVLDLDTFCLSGASADAGNFLGYLDLTAVRRPRLQPIIEDCVRSFVDGLIDADVTSREWVAWYRGIAHVKKGIRAFFSLEPHWPETAARLFSLTDQMLREAV